MTNIDLMSFSKPSKMLQAYANAGAFIQEDLSEASVIFGVKQVPVDSLQRDKTFCFFSHTIKVCCIQVIYSAEPQLAPRDNLRIQTTEA